MDMTNDFGSMPNYGGMMGGYPGMEPDFGMMPQPGPAMMPPMMPPMMPQAMPYAGQPMMPYGDVAAQNPTAYMEYMYMYYKYMCKYMEYMEKSKEFNKKNRE